MYIIRVYNDDNTWFDINDEIYTTIEEAEYWGERTIMGAWNVIDVTTQKIVA